jgi:tetratricopeptide (TPR) repeat protein
MPLSRFVYDPWEIPPEQRKATFVGREPILDRLLAAIREQEGRATVQHYILTGPRGIGKTSLLLTLRDRIRQEPELSPKWFCVQLREEEYYVHKQRDLWQLVLEALAVEEKVEEARQVVKQAEEIPDNEKSSALLVDGLRSICQRHGKRLALLVDNFGQIFPTTAAGEAKHRKPDSEYRAFRKRLSTESFLMLIATSVKLFQDIYAYDKGFFNFFSPVELPELTQEEFVEMLRRLGEADESAAFVSRLERSKGNLRTLYFLTGGNPRFVTVLYQILAQNEMSDPVQALWETVAGLTPMLRHELADMPRQQSKTLDALLRLNGVAAPAEIAKSSRLPLNVVTTQLGRLKEARYVTLEGGGKGKKATYRIADQMFSVWYWMRYVPVARRRIELFTDFLRAWFSSEERKRLFQERWEKFHKYQSRGSVGMAGKALRDAEYYAASFDDPTERKSEMERIADAYTTVGDLPSAAGLFAELAGTKVKSTRKFESLGYSVLANRLVKKGDLNGALKSYSEALAKDPQNGQTRALFGLCLGQKGRHAEAKEQFDRIPQRARLEASLRSLVLITRGVARSHLGDPQGALADYTAVAELSGAPAEMLALALVKRGATRGELGDLQSAVADCNAVLELKGAPTDQLAMALALRGAAKSELGETPGAVADYTALVGLKGAPTELVATALGFRGAAKSQVGEMQGAMADYTALVELNGAPPDAVALAVFDRGVIKAQLNDLQGAISDFSLVLELKGALPEQVIKAQFNRGNAKGRLGDPQGAAADYTALVERKDASAEQVAKALVNRGATRSQLGDPEGAIADYSQVLELKGAPPEQVVKATFNRGLIKGQLGDPQGAIADLTALVEEAIAPAEQVAMARMLRGSAYIDIGQHGNAVSDFTLALEIHGPPEKLRIETMLYRGMSHEKLGEPEQALADYSRCAQGGVMPFVHKGLQSTVGLLLLQKRVDEALGWVHRFHELEPREASLETRLEARLDMIRAASVVASLEEASRLVDALLEADPEELRARLQFLKPGLELARTHDASVLANLPEDERKIAKEIARSLAEAARPTVVPPPASAGEAPREPTDSPPQRTGPDSTHPASTR